MFGLTQIRKAEVFLSGPPGHIPSQEDLTEAFHCIWAALRFADLWPEPIRDRAADLIVAMLRHGPYHETARRMSAEEIREFAAAVRRFVVDAENRHALPSGERSRAAARDRRPIGYDDAPSRQGDVTQSFDRSLRA